MKLLLVHNSYRHRGGEDAVFRAEGEMLQKNGHDISLFEVSNDYIFGFVSQLRVGLQTVYSFAARRRLREVLKRNVPDVVHVHNFFPLLTPSIYDACVDAGVAVVQTLHNYRLLCPSALLMQDGKVCEECIAKGPFQGVRYSCYRGSRLQTLPVALMLAFHRWRRTWHDRVNRFIVLTEFARDKFIQAGFSPQQLVVKPNFVALPDQPPKRGGAYALFVGRLSSEKGVETLLEAWGDLGGIPLKLIGDGPLLDKALSMSCKSVEVLGWKSHGDVLSLLGDALFLVLPSEWYEGFPIVITEAMACGKPVVTSRLGAMADIIDDGRTGLLFEPRNAKDLASKMRWLFEHQEEAEEMGRNSRAEYEVKYTAERSYKLLMDIYSEAIQETKDHKEKERKKTLRAKDG
jgi:glycosyltransferase involved in cell wall biosynthesis